MNLKVNDILVCHDGLIHSGLHSSKNLLVVGQTYRIEHIDDDYTEFYLINSKGETHWFSLIDGSESYYGTWLTSLQDNRKEKLNKIYGL